MLISDNVAEDTVDDTQTADENTRSFRRAYDTKYTAWAKEAERFDRYYAGEQWEKEDLDALKALKRPALTLNLIQPTIDAMLGEFMNKRATFAAKPTTTGDQQTADVLTKVMMNIADRTNFIDVEQTVFSDGLIMDRGYYDIRMDFADNVSGDISITAIDPLTVIPDPQGKEYDPDTWREVIVHKWMSVDDVSELYGEELAEKVKNEALENNLSTDIAEYTRDRSFGDSDHGPAYDGIPSDQRTLKRIRVIDRQHVRMDKFRVFVDPITGNEERIPDSWDDMRIAAYQSVSNAYILMRHKRRVRWTITAGNVVLHDDWSPYPFFTVVPYFPKFRRGKPLGAVRQLIDPQNQFNKVSSQILHAINSTANSGWELEEGALVNMTPEELAANGSKTGLVLVRAPGKQIAKIQPNQMPSGLAQFSEFAQNMIRKISGVSEYMVGEGSSEVSGIALDARVNRNLVQLQPVFDSLNRARNVLAKRLLKLIQMYYTDQRMFRITSETETGEQTAEMLEVNVPTFEGNIVNDLSLGEYDVVVTSQPSRETFVETQFAQVIQMAQAGIQIPPDVFVELSNFSRKNEIAERIRQQMGVGQPSPEQQQAMQQQQEIQMQQMMLEMQKLQAQINELNTQAELNQAKAYAAVTNPSIEYKGTVAKQQTSLQNKAAELDAKTSIARMQTMARAAEGGRVRGAEPYRPNQTQSMTAGEGGI